MIIPKNEKKVIAGKHTTKEQADAYIKKHKKPFVEANHMYDGDQCVLQNPMEFKALPEGGVARVISWGTVEQIWRWRHSSETKFFTKDYSLSEFGSFGEFIAHVKKEAKGMGLDVAKNNFMEQRLTFFND